MDVMNSDWISVDRISDDDGYRLAYPCLSDRCESLLAQFPYIPFVLVDEKERLVAGFEFMKYYRDCNEASVPCTRIESAKVNPILLAYHYKERFFGFNPYEQLVFIRKALATLKVSEIYQQCRIDISINDELRENLDLLITRPFREALIGGQLNLKSALLLCNWNQTDRSGLIDLFTSFPFTKSQQLNLIEMLEELIFRDKQSLRSIFADLKLALLHRENKPQKSIIDRVHAARFPAYTASKAAFDKRIRQLKLPPHMQLTHFPFFEKRKLELKIEIESIDQLEDLSLF